MMTSREAQIYQWITENPMISQEELAEKAGIKRSSAAVHISNLMKKGYILGKGYITNGPNYCTVIGGANMDIGGIPEESISDMDPADGKVIISQGGIARNIAHNMSMLGLNAKLITALGDDGYAHKIIERCDSAGVDTTDSLRSVENQTAIYTYIVDNGGKMRLAISDTHIYEKITPDFIKTKMDKINRGRLAVIDAGLPEETIYYIAENAAVPLFAETVSTKKGKNLLRVLNKLHTIAPTQIEAEELSGVKITDEFTVKRAASIILSKGVKNVFITFKEHGIFYANEWESGFLGALECNVVNDNGARDAIMAGLALAYIRHLPIKDAALVGRAAACIAVESEETINPHLSIAEISNRTKMEL